MTAHSATSPAVATAPGSEPLVEAVDVDFAFGRNQVLEDVSLRIDPATFVALVGPNGSGKSTLVRLLLGSLAPSNGTVRLFGEPPRRVADRWRLGYVPQRPVLASEVPATVQEIVAAGRLARSSWWRPLTRQDRAAVHHALESVGMEDLARRPVNELSGGQQQRAFIARALASEPTLLVLDEPIAGVDAESQRRFRDSLIHLMTEHGAGILLVSHELSAVAQDLDRVIVLKRRVLFDGTPAELTREGISLGVHREDLPLWLEGLQ